MKKIFLFLLTTLFMVNVSNAQVLRGIPSDEKKKEAQEQLTTTNYNQAIRWANEYKKDLPKSKDAVAIIGVSELYMRDYGKAEIALKELLENDKKDQKFQEYRFEYARALKYQGKYKEAADQFNSYAKYGKDDNKRKMAGVELKGIEMAQKAKAVLCADALVQRRRGVRCHQQMRRGVRRRQQRRRGVRRHQPRRRPRQSRP